MADTQKRNTGSQYEVVEEVAPPQSPSQPTGSDYEVVEEVAAPSSSAPAKVQAGKEIDQVTSPSSPFAGVNRGGVPSANAPDLGPAPRKTPQQKIAQEATQAFGESVSQKYPPKATSPGTPGVAKLDLPPVPVAGPAVRQPDVQPMNAGFGSEVAAMQVPFTGQGQLYSTPEQDEAQAQQLLAAEMKRQGKQNFDDLTQTAEVIEARQLLAGAELKRHPYSGWARSFFGNVWPGGEGVGEITTGAADIAGAENRRDVYRGGSEMIGGTMQALTPGFAKGMIENAGRVGTGLITGYVASEIGKKSAEEAGASPEAAQLIGDVMFFVPSVVSLRGKNENGVKVGGVSAFGDRVAVGAGKTPTQKGAFVRVGPYTAEVKTGVPPAKPGIPQIEGEVLPPEPATAAEAQARAQIQEGIQAAAAATAGDAASMQTVATGQPPMPPAPTPEPPAPPLTDQVLRGISAAIQAAPEEARGALIAEAHGNLSKALLEQGKVTLGGKLYVVDSEKKASTVAQKLINDEIGRLDKEAAQQDTPKTSAVPAKEQAAEAGTGAPAPTEAPAPEAGSYEVVEDLGGAAGHVTLKKGEQVRFTDNEGVERTGTVKYAGNLAVRLVDEQGLKYEVAPSKVRGLAAAQPAPAEPAAQPEPSPQEAPAETPSGVESSAMPSTPGAGEKSVQPKQETPAGAVYYSADRTVGDNKGGNSLGTYLTTDRAVAEGYAAGRGRITEHKLSVNKPLRIVPEVGLQERFGLAESAPEWFTAEEINKQLKAAGVKYKFDPEEFTEYDDFWRYLDAGGPKLVNAFKKAGYDALAYPDSQGAKSFETTLVFDKSSLKPASPSSTPPSTAGTAQTAPAPSVAPPAETPQVTPPPEPAASQEPTAAQGTPVKATTQPTASEKLPKKDNPHYPYDPGDVVVFDEVPSGSYLTAGEPYRITSVGKQSVYFESVKDGAGSYETYRSLNRTAKYHKVEGSAPTPEAQAPAVPEPEPPVHKPSTELVDTPVPETPEQELARLRKELAQRQAEKAAPQKPSEETPAEPAPTTETPTPDAQQAITDARDHLRVAEDNLREAQRHHFAVAENQKAVAEAKAALAAAEKAAEPKEPITGLIDAVYDKLSRGESLGNVTEFNKLADQHLGAGWRTSGTITPKDAFDAMEAGVNKYLLAHGKDLMGKNAIEGLADLRRNVMDKLTSQGTRTEEQITHQQFSTPPTESYLVSKVANIQPSDVVLEPSAGNGGLAAFAQAVGAKVHVNEIAPRRQKMLDAVGFQGVTAHDGEVINSLLDQSVKPTVVVMNPPFSAKASAAGRGANSNKYGFNHVDSALQRLEPGGRLVAILGGGRDGFPTEGATFANPAADKWFDKVGAKYNIRANVRISGKEYQKYGTSYATRIVVIDKDGPTASRVATGSVPKWGGVVQGSVDTLEQAYNLLRPVAETRPNVTAATTRPASPVGAGDGQSIPGAGTRPAGVPQAGGGSVPTGSAGRPAPVAGPERPVGSDRGNEPAAGSELPATSEPGPQPPAAPADETAGSVSGSGSDAQERPLGIDARGLSPTPPETLDLAQEGERNDREVEDSGAYVPYQPTIKGPAHPGDIVETKTMATVPLPKLTYRPSLPDSVITQGRLSAVQLEAIAIAGQQNNLRLPGGERASALIGDGTGVGKGRIGAGVLWDNWRQGRKRLVWVSEKWDLMQDAIRDLKGIGALELASKVKAFQKFDVTKPIEHNGIIFTTYASVRSADKKGNTRIGQLEKWLRGEDDAEGAYILYDESHNLKNAVTAGRTPPSQIGKTAKEFMGRVPNLRSVSLSATAASDVMNLGYLDRLGLWGPGTPFPAGFQQFAADIAGGGISAMEMIARELKAQGKYVARTLSYKGVTYDMPEHKLTEEQKEVYRTAAKAWRAVQQKAEATIMDTLNGGGRARGNFLSQFYSAQQRFFNLLITTLKIPSAVELANKALADKQSVLITLVNTNEAAQNREKDRVAADTARDADEPPDYDFGPKKLLTDLVRNHYPTQQWVDDIDDQGRPFKGPLTDAEGHPIQNPEAVRARDALVKEIERDLNMPDNPLDILINSLGGPSKVAELTGRKERVDASTGRLVPRGGEGIPRDKVNLEEMRAFQAGKKRVAILSSAAGTGISLHAGNDVANKQKRYHITLQAGWSADKAMQMLGRSHRTNQAQPPHYAMLVSDLGGEKRFISSISRRLGSLGALSRGQKNATSGTDAMDKFNFETNEGRAAARAFYDGLLRRGATVPGTDINGMEVLRDMGVLKEMPNQGETVPDEDKANITRLLNRILSLDPERQNAVYDYYYDVFQAVVQRAIDDGTLDTGVRTLPGDSFHVKEERAIATDPQTNAKTFYYPVEAEVRTHRVSPKELAQKLKDYRDLHARLLVNDKGDVILVHDARPIVHADGQTDEASYVYAPANGIAHKSENWKLHRYKEPQEALKADVESARGEVESAERTVSRDKVWVEKGWTEQSELDKANAELATAQKSLADAEEAAADPKGWALDQWQKQYDAAPAHTKVEHHLIGGAVLHWWNPIKDAAGVQLHVFTTVDSKTGKRVVGVEIPPERVRGLLDRITGGASTVNSSQLAIDVIKNNLTYTLEQGIQVRRGRLAGNWIVQLIPPNGNIAQNLKSLGVVYERGVQPVYYIPNTDRGNRPDEDIIEDVLKEYPVQPANDPQGDDQAHSFEALAEDPDAILSEVKQPEGDLAPVVRLSAGAQLLMKRATGDNYAGTNINADKAREIAEQIRGVEQTEGAEKLASDLERAADLVEDSGVSIAVNAATEAEEGFHGLQRKVGGGTYLVRVKDPNALLNTDAGAKMWTELATHGYADAGPHRMVSEIAAKIATGRMPATVATPEEQADWLTEYTAQVMESAGYDRAKVLNNPKVITEAAHAIMSAAEEAYEARGKERGSEAGRGSLDTAPGEAQGISRAEDQAGAVAQQAETEAGHPAGEGPAGLEQAYDRYTFEDPEMEQAYQDAHGLKKEPLLKQMAEWATRLKHLINRKYEFLERGAQWEPARFGLTRLEHRKGGTREEAAEALKKILADLNPDEYNLFERYVLMRDLAATAKAGDPIPDKFTPEGVDKELARLEQTVAAPENAKVKTAFDDRKREQERLKQEYLQVFKDLGLDMSDKFTREDYFRHQVLKYADDSGLFGTGQKFKAPMGRGFLKKREGSKEAINTDYLQAEYEYMAQVRYDIEMAKFGRDVVDRQYNIINDLKRAAVRENEAAVMELFKDLVRADQPGMAPEDVADAAGKMFRQTLNRKQAMAISRLIQLAMRGELPNGTGKNDFTDLLETLSDMGNEEAAAKADLEENYEGPGKLDGGTIKKLIRYAGWVLKANPGTEAASKAALLFKGMKEKRDTIKKTLGDNFATWRSVIPDGYVTWQFKDGFQFFSTLTIPENVAQQIEAGLLKDLNIQPNQVQRVLARGGRFKEMVIPEELAATLDHLKPAIEVGPFGRIPKWLMSRWKEYQLVSPRRFFKYNLRNLSGDAEAAFIGNPSTFSKVPQAVSELLDFFRSGHQHKTPMLRAWIERGGMETLLQAQEIGDINSLNIFKSLYEKEVKGKVSQYPAKVWYGYWQAARLSTDFREAILRYSAFLDYMDQQTNGKGLKNYGASIPAEVMALDTPGDRAFKLSNDLLGAYDDISALGQWMRNYVPFWSFQEVNPKRYYRFFKNAFGEAGYRRGEDTGRAAWRAFEQVTGKAARSMPFLAWKVGKLLLKMATLWAMFTAWNNLMYRDEEEGLSSETKDSPHIILGHGKDNVYVMPRLGNLPDILDWIGVDAPQRNLEDWLNGRKTAGEVAKNVAAGGPNKLFGALGPFAGPLGFGKLPMELAFGKTGYPDVFHPRPIPDRGKYLAQQFGLQSEYTAIKGEPSRGYLPSLASLFLNEYERGSGAYYDILAQKRRYLESIGKSSGGDYSLTPRAEALRNVKLAIKFHDRVAWQRYAKEYMLLGGDEDNIEDALERMHPLGGLTQDEMEGFVAKLSPKDRDELRRATDFYQRMILQQ